MQRIFICLQLTTFECFDDYSTKRNVIAASNEVAIIVVRRVQHESDTTVWRNSLKFIILLHFYIVGFFEQVNYCTFQRFCDYDIILISETPPSHPIARSFPQRKLKNLSLDPTRRLHFHFLLLIIHWCDHQLCIPPLDCGEKEKIEWFFEFIALPSPMHAFSGLRTANLKKLRSGTVSHRRERGWPGLHLHPSEDGGTSLSKWERKSWRLFGKSDKRGKAKTGVMKSCPHLLIAFPGILQ